MPAMLGSYGPWTASLLEGSSLESPDDFEEIRAYNELAGQHERILRDCCAKAGAAEAFSMSYRDGPHTFDVPMQEEAFAWLSRWLA